MSEASAGGQFVSLEHLFAWLAESKQTIDDVAERVGDDTGVLRDLADVLQHVRHTYWPLYLKARKESGNE